MFTNEHEYSTAKANSKPAESISESSTDSPPDSESEVVAPCKRRYRTASFKLRIIAEADICERRGELGALLRREGLYHSDLASWRNQKAQGILVGTPVPRSLRKDPEYQDALRLQAEMARENRDLRRQLGRAKLIIDIQKKAALLLGETLQEMSLDEPLENDLD
jgi:transposase-like protein